MSQRDDALAALTEIHNLAIIHAGTACWKAIDKHMPLLKAVIEEQCAAITMTEVVGADGKGVAAPCAISGCALFQGHATLSAQSANGFTKLATLIGDIKIDRYGRPLIAALHLCNDLADDLYRAKLSQPEEP